MDHHKSLYKESRSQIVSPRKHNILNRQLQEAKRSKQRKDRFQNSRNISHSQTPHKPEIKLEAHTEDKENLDATTNENSNSTRLAKIVCNAKNPQKLTKQESFLKRYIEWKENKKKRQEQDASNKKKPFISAVNSAKQQTITSSSIVPKGHHREFRPPNLKNPKESEKASSTIKGRQSVYTVVPTPPRKTRQVDDKILNKFPIARKALPTNLHARFVNSKNILETGTNLTGKKATEIALNNITSGNKQKATRSPANKSIAKIALFNSARSLEKAKKVGTTSTTASLKTNLKPKTLKMSHSSPLRPAVKNASTNKKSENIPVAAAAVTSKQAGAAGKVRAMLVKHMDNSKQTKHSSRNSARLAQNLKAKKPINAQKVSVAALQVNSKDLLNLFNNQTDENMVIQTPKDFATLNPFEEFVTSTKLRNSSHNTIEATHTVEPSNKRSNGSSSVKRNLMREESMMIKPNEPQNALDGSENTVKKYNFIRYSEAADVSLEDKINIVNESRHENKKNTSLDNKDETIVNNVTPSEEKTPIKFGPEERPVNYLSPFVSVTRGKVSLRKEQKKRDSIYFQNHSENNDLTKENISPNSAKYSVETRRTLEAVRYFRKQLQDEIDRLHKLCDVWESYKEDNLKKIQNANGEDMINVTIGQTRLLTSKKFMQFKGLIDRCEAGATGIGAIEYDGSENTKPITAVDLEGFWSMLGLQIDNLDKRFNNLNRWKLNNWEDPDEVKPKIRNNLTKVKKAKVAPAAKAKPNSALKQMLRKMQAEMRKNKNKENENANDDVELTPSKQKQRRSTNCNNNSVPRKSVNKSTPRRLSIVVKDRKYFSPAATVISVSSPNCRVSKLQRKSSQDSPRMIKHRQNFNEALDNLQSLNLRKSVLINGNTLVSCPTVAIENNNHNKYSVSENGLLNSDLTKNSKDETLNHVGLSAQSDLTSPEPTGRKSILKTPGTAKSKLRNVIFNEKLRVKKFTFLINDDGRTPNADNGEDANDTHEEDLAKSFEDESKDEDGTRRTLTLRNRKVRLRPSCEIVIPIK